MKILSRISFTIDKVCGLLIVLMLAAMVVLTTGQIICRTWFTSLSWAEEATRFLLIWATFIGATCVYRHGGNIAITAIQNLFPGSANKALRIAVHVICFLLFTALFYYGIQYCAAQKRSAAAIPIKMKYIYICIPVSMCIMMLHSFVMALETAFKKEDGK